MVWVFSLCSYSSCAASIGGARLCRDIKLENALLDRNKRLLKITDFGYAKTAADSLPKSEVGTPNYAGALPLNTCLQAQDA